MSYNIIPNIIFIIALVGVILIILRHLPKATTEEPASTSLATSEQRLMEKGLPVIWASKFRTWLVFWGRRGWHFVLEAKGIQQQAQVGYRIKKIFKKSQSADAAKLSGTLPVAAVPPEPKKDEAFYLAEIKKNPKDLGNYAGLALLYTEVKNFGEAKDLYEYLVKHDAGNADYHARLGYAYYLLDEFEQAVQSYNKSLALDATHPGRFYNLGLAHKALNNIQEAETAFRKALSLEPANRNYKEALDELKQL